MRYLMVYGGIVLMLVACGGSDDPTAGKVMTQITQYAQRQQYDRAFAAIAPSQQHEIGKDRFLNCLYNDRPSTYPIKISDEYATTVTLNGQQTDARGVTLAIGPTDSTPWEGTYTLVRQNGEWQWVWPETWVQSIQSGSCPRIWPDI